MSIQAAMLLFLLSTTTRTSFLRSSLLPFLITTPPFSFSKAVLNNNNQRPLSVEQAIHIIKTSTPHMFLQIVKNSGGKFLYRGEEACSDNQCWILNPDPDLLIPDTYSDPSSLKYFECLEKYILTLVVKQCDDNKNVPNLQQELPTKIHPKDDSIVKLPTQLDCVSKNTVRPSTGHIGTPIQQKAQAWGTAASIWPLGNELSYAWPRDRFDFWPLQDTEKDDQPSDSNCISYQPSFENVVIDVDLVEALRGGHEVLFQSEGYLAIPSVYDGKLRMELGF